MNTINKYRDLDKSHNNRIVIREDFKWLYRTNVEWTLVQWTQLNCVIDTVKWLVSDCIIQVIEYKEIFSELLDENMYQTFKNTWTLYNFMPHASWNYIKDKDELLAIITRK